jgi:hypothetical protein
MLHATVASCHHVISTHMTATERLAAKTIPCTSYQEMKVSSLAISTDIVHDIMQDLPTTMMYTLSTVVVMSCIGCSMRNM